MNGEEPTLNIFVAMCTILTKKSKKKRKRYYEKERVANLPAPHHAIVNSRSEVTSWGLSMPLSLPTFMERSQIIDWNGEKKKKK